MNIDHKIIGKNAGFPNNPELPVLHYKKAISQPTAESIRQQFESNGWQNCWVDGIYSFHHFHSNTHEVLGIASGTCEVQLGGDQAHNLKVEAGDCLVIPAGVAHKNISSSEDFVCVGGYPTFIPYDMHEGNEEELAKAIEQIAHVPLPQTDPLFGNSGPIFEYWHG